MDSSVLPVLQFEWPHTEGFKVSVRYSPQSLACTSPGFESAPRRRRRRRACIVPAQARREREKKNRAISSTQITPHNVIGPLATPWPLGPELGSHVTGAESDQQGRSGRDQRQKELAGGGHSFGERERETRRPRGTWGLSLTTLGYTYDWMAGRLGGTPDGFVGRWGGRDW